MRNAGFEVAIYDSALKEGPHGIKVLLTTFKPDYLVLYDDSFNYLSKMCLSVMRDAAFELIQYGRAAGCAVLVNSSDATDHPEKYLDAGADVVLLGESDMTLLQLLTDGIDKAEACKGVAINSNGQLVKTNRRNDFKELDLLPMPAWDLVDLEPYKKIWKESHGYFSLNIATTRGCPFKCNWCAKPIYGNRYHSRSPEMVVQEMKLLMDEFGATHFWICDDIFGLKPGWVKKFSKLLIDNSLHPKLKIQCRADLLLKEETIDELVAAGLDEVWIGAESGSQKILDAMEKGTTVQQIYLATNLLKSKGVKVCFFLQYGYLGETKADIELTLKMVRELMPHDIGISVSYPLPNTGFYDKVKTQFQAKQNWNDSDDLAMLYQGTFIADFYRQLHKHTHYVFRKRYSANNLKRIFKAQSISHDTIKSAIKFPYLFLAEIISSLKLKTLESR